MATAEHQGDDQQDAAGSQGQHRLPRIFTEKKDAAQQAEEGHPEGADAEQPHQNAGEIGAEDTEQVLDLGRSAGVEKQARIGRIK